MKKGEGGFESHTLLRMTTEWNGVGLGVASQFVWKKFLVWRKFPPIH